MKKSFHSLAGFFVLLSVAVSTAVADPATPSMSMVKPGDPAVTGAFIEPYRNAWNYSKVSPSGEVKRLGRWTDQVTISGEPGQETITRRQHFPSPAGVRVLVNRFRQADLLPLSFEVATEGGQLLQRVDFEAGELRITQLGQKEPTVKPLAEKVFDWYLYGLLVASFPLEEGYSVAFPALSPTLEPMARHLRVTGRESKPGPDGSPLPCWRVETDEDLTFWIADQAPYILHLTKKLDDGGMMVWELDTDSEHANYLELRIYKTKEGQRDRFLDYFEEHYLESQEAVGMRIWGQFRDLEAAENVVWLRGYRSMEERQAGLFQFYTGAHWAETSPALGEMFAERATHVHFLEPVWSGDGFDDLDRVTSSSLGGIVVAQVFLAESDLFELARSFRRHVIAPFGESGGISLGLFRNSDEKNNFPLLPFIEDEKVLVWFASFASRGAFEVARGSLEMDAPLEIFILEPGKLSRLHHREP